MSSTNDSEKDTLCEAETSPGTGVDHKHSLDAKTEDIEELTRPVLPWSEVPTPSSRRKLHFRDIRTSGPSRRFHPTSVRVDVGVEDIEEDEEVVADASPDKTLGFSRATTKQSMSEEVGLLWRSRDNRKGRNSLVVRSSRTESQHPVSFNHRFGAELKSIGVGVGRMCITFRYWDLAFWSGWSYSIGSLLFVLDGVFAWMAVTYPGDDFGTDTVSLLFFVGALFYQIGATTAYLEAVNDGSFPGSPMRRFLEGHEEDHKKLLDEKISNTFGHMVPLRHRKKRKIIKDSERRADHLDPEAGWNAMDRPERPGSIYPPGKKPASRRGGIDLGEDVETGESSQYMTWRWWPSWHCLWTYHIFEIGYIANAVQLPGATLYSIAGVVGLPGVYDQLDAQWKVNVAYWIVQIVASVCFLTAGFLFTFETQEKWYKPELKVLGWWIGFWASVGSVGFLLSAGFGPGSFDNDTAAYQSPLSSMWGSGAYLISSLVQWYEAVNKNPVAEILKEPGKMKTSQAHGL